MRYFKQVLALVFFSILLVQCDDPAPVYELNISVTPSGGGSVNPPEGSYEDGTVVNLVATPSEFYEFVSWSGDATGSNNTVSIVMDASKSVTATFQLMDADGDGIPDNIDQCTNTPQGETANETGCSPSQRDSDGDGVTDQDDICPDTPQGEEVNSDGCTDSQIDTDGDGVPDIMDQCADTPQGAVVNADGCADSQLDTDGDGVTDDIDACPNTPEGAVVDERGCELHPIYIAENGITVKARDFANVGEEYEINGVTYTVVDKAMLGEWIAFNRDVSKVVTTFITNMDDLFGGGETVIDEANGIYEYEHAPRAFDHNIASWDVSNVTSMVRIFAGMATVRDDTHDLTSWDVSKVTNMKGLLKNTSFLGSNFFGWDTSNVTDMSELLMNSTAFDTGYTGIGDWDTSSVKNMRRAVFGTFMWGLNWDVSGVEDMSEMFMKSVGGTALGSLETWDVGNVKNMSGMFRETPSFNTQIGNWDVSNVEDMSNMFYMARSFSRDIADWNVGKVKDMSSMFYAVPLFNRDLSGWDVSSVTECSDFSVGTDAWLAPKPNFTNCDPN